jgi:hypothetical protein
MDFLAKSASENIQGYSTLRHIIHLPVQSHPGRASEVTDLLLLILNLYLVIGWVSFWFISGFGVGASRALDNFSTRGVCHFRSSV